MQCLAHRGVWREPQERNTKDAFGRAFAAGFGVELDVRDLAGELVVSHDPPAAAALPFAQFAALYDACGRGRPVAINVKSCGLAPLLAAALERCTLANYFVFDWAVPDALPYLDLGLRLFTRVSEYEPTPAFYDRAAGVWLDTFTRDVGAAPEIEVHLERGKQVALVSPELHGREHLATWARYARLAAMSRDAVMLCTDHPAAAAEVFAAGAVRR